MKREEKMSKHACLAHFCELKHPRDRGRGMGVGMCKCLEGARQSTRIRARLAELLEQNDAAVKLLLEVHQWHSDEETTCYNGCDTDPCAWCQDALRIINGETI